jgi:BMFP domain-containing protein YqiC
LGVAYARSPLSNPETLVASKPLQIFDDLSKAIREPRQDVGAAVRVILLDVASKLLMGLAIGLGVGIGMALAG